MEFLNMERSGLKEFLDEKYFQSLTYFPVKKILKLRPSFQQLLRGAKDLQLFETQQN